MFIDTRGDGGGGDRFGVRWYVLIGKRPKRAWGWITALAFEARPYCSRRCYSLPISDVDAEREPGERRCATTSAA
jgi:hypothetical protein